MLIRRDPFARTELHRKSVPITVGNILTAACDWCGQKPARLFKYWTESDSGRKWEHQGQFCNLSCHNSFHDL